MDARGLLRRDENLDSAERSPIEVGAELETTAFEVVSDTSEFAFTASGGLQGWIFTIPVRLFGSLGTVVVTTMQFIIERDPCLPNPSPPVVVPPPSTDLNLDAGVFSPGNNTGNCP